MPRKIFSCIAIVVASSTIVVPAFALLEPTSADRDVRAAMNDGIDAFCTSPPDPLPEDSRRVCDLAKELPNCSALVARCDTAAKSNEDIKPPVPSWTQTAAPIANILTWVLAFALAIILLIPVVRWLSLRMRDAKLADEAPPEEKTTKKEAPPPIDTSDAEALLARADALTRGGETTAALLTYLEASLRALDRRGAIHVARHRTNGEYVRSCNEATNKPLLREVVRTVDAVQFGGTRPTDEMVGNVATRARTIVAFVAMAIAMMLLASCGGGGMPRPKRGADPLGDDLFLELLHRQNVDIQRVGPLSSLPIDDADESAPILIDAEVVPIDDRSAERLQQWVEAGGRLVLFGPPKALRDPLALRLGDAASRDVKVVLPPQLEMGQKDVDDPFVYQLDDLARITTAARVLRETAATRDGGAVLATIGDRPYAVAFSLKLGRVIFVATDDLLGNVALAHEGNAATLAAILRVFASDGVRVARREDGTSFADSPATSLVRAGLGPAMVQMALAALLLFLAVGVRARRPKPAPPPTRRAFAEHVRATGALWARAKATPHALASYARWIDEQVRARAPVGSDPAAWLAARAGADFASTAETWQRAMRAKSTDAPEGDELLVLKRLGVLYSQALSQERR
jgi:hypothetical protein